jgi:uncharacterized protein YbjT (DUF2867 family)
MPKLMGGSRKVGWLATDDLGAIAAKAFSQPAQFISQDVHLASDIQTIDECSRIYRAVMGRPPRRIPMPVWLFERIVGPDLTTMWHWLRTHEIDLDTAPTRAIHPGAVTVDSWLRTQKDAPSGKRRAK